MRKIQFPVAMDVKMRQDLERVAKKHGLRASEIIRRGIVREIAELDVGSK